MSLRCVRPGSCAAVARFCPRPLRRLIRNQSWRWRNPFSWTSNPDHDERSEAAQTQARTIGVLLVPIPTGLAGRVGGDAERLHRTQNRSRDCERGRVVFSLHFAAEPPVRRSMDDMALTPRQAQRVVRGCLASSGAPIVAAAVPQARSGPRPQSREPSVCRVDRASPWQPAQLRRLGSDALKSPATV